MSMRQVSDYLPSPLDVPPMEGCAEGEDGAETVIIRKPADAEPFSALAFKVREHEAPPESSRSERDHPLLPRPPRTGTPQSTYSASDVRVVRRAVANLPATGIFSLPFCDGCPLRAYSLFPSAMGARY
eukprot:3304141-Pyramimonas_sp.AAC.1